MPLGGSITNAGSDLHIHSNYNSDGEFSPKDLVDLCLEAGLSHAAIVGHKSVKDIDVALQAAYGTTLRMIPSIAMDCVFTDIIPL